MPTPATFTVASTAVYRSADGNDARQFFAGDVIDYLDAIHFQMVAAPAALPPIVGGLRLDPNNFSVDADGVVTVAAGAVTGGGLLVPYAAPSAAGLQVNFAVAGPAEYDMVSNVDYGDQKFALRIDLAGRTSVRAFGQVATAQAGWSIVFRYAPAGDTTFVDLGATAVTLDLGVTGWADTGDIALVAGALAVVDIHPFFVGADTTGGASLAPYYLQFK